MPKTKSSTERVRALRARRKAFLNVQSYASIGQHIENNNSGSFAKSSTERGREFRARQSAVLNVQHNISIAHNASTLQNSENDQLFDMGKTMFAHWQIKRQKKVMTAAERVQKFREKRRKLRAIANQAPPSYITLLNPDMSVMILKPSIQSVSGCNNVDLTIVPSTKKAQSSSLERVRRHRARKKLLSSAQNLSLAEGVDKQMLHNKNSLMKPDMIEEENRTTIADTIEEVNPDLCIKEEIEVGEYTITENSNQLTYEQPQEFWEEKQNEVGEYLTNDDSNEMIEIYAVIDEDDDYNDENLLDADKKTKNTSTIVDETQNTMNQKYNIKQESENEEYPPTEAEFTSLEKLKEEPIEETLWTHYVETNTNSAENEIYTDEELFQEPQAVPSLIRNSIEESIGAVVKPKQNEANYISKENNIYKICAVIDEDNDDKNSMNFVEQTEKNLTTAKENKYKEIQEYYSIKQENENEEYTAREAEFYKYSQEPFLDQLKKEPIEINANEDIKEEENPFEEPQAMQSHTQMSCVVPFDPEINQGPTETEADSDKNKNYEVFQEPQAIKCLLQRKYILTMENEIKQKPVETIVNLSQPAASKEHANLNTITFEDPDVGGDYNENVQYKEHKMHPNEDPNEIVTSDDNVDNHLTEQRVLQIGKILRLNSYGKLSCEILTLDPIICAYTRILSNGPPKFSENALRMSFQDVLVEQLYSCHYQYSIRPEDLELYRHIVLLAYSTKYELFRLKDIMKDIFNESKTKTILNNSPYILEEWRTFFNKHFISMRYRKAVYEILFEFRTRHSLVSAQLDRNAVYLPQTTTKDIQEFLHCDFELGNNWSHQYITYIKKKVNKNPTDFCRVFKTTDLSLNRIYADIKERLPQLVVENLCYAREKGGMLNVKRDILESSKAVDHLNVNISMESKEGKAASENDEQNDKFHTMQTNTHVLLNRISEKKSKIISSIEEPPNKKQKIEQNMLKVVSKKKCKYVRSNAILIKTVEHLKGIDMNIKKNLGKDPIIMKYFQLNAKKPAGKNFPVFSEYLLRLSFDAVLKKSRREHPISDDDYLLYRQLILFKYSEQYSSVDELAEIMTCFTVFLIRLHFMNYAIIIHKWNNFSEKFLSVQIFKQALSEMIFEYARRLMLISNTNLTNNQLYRKTKQIKKFFGQSFKLPDNWFRDFYSTLSKPVKAIAETENNTEINKDTCLQWHNIYESIKSRLHVLVIEKREMLEWNRSKSLKSKK